MKPINQFKIDFEREGLDVIFLKNWSSGFFSNCRILLKSVKEFNPDVVVAFMFIAIIFARLLKLLVNFKLISTIRISVINNKWYLPFRITSFLDDGVVYNSKASKIRFESRKLVSKEGVVIYNGITLPQLKAPQPENPFRQFSWVCIGHFRYNKDYQTLFKAIAQLKDKNFKVTILGELNNQTWPFKVIEELGIEEYVQILGFRPNAVEYLEDADAFVLSSFSEGMPNAILEAMAHGKPVVATNIEGNHEVITESEGGFLNELANPEDLADKMLAIMKMTPAKRFVLGNNGRRLIEANFAEEKVMLHWLNVVKQISGKQALQLNKQYA